MFDDRNLSFMEHGYEDVLMHHGMIIIVLALEIPKGRESTLTDIIKTKFVSNATEAHNPVSISVVRRNCSKRITRA